MNRDESEIREQFMATVYDWLSEDGTNDRANHIIGAFDDATAELTADLAAMTAERDAMRERAEAAICDLSRTKALYSHLHCAKHSKCFQWCAERGRMMRRSTNDCPGWEWRGPLPTKPTLPTATPEQIAADKPAMAKTMRIWAGAEIVREGEDEG